MQTMQVVQDAREGHPSFEPCWMGGGDKDKIAAQTVTIRQTVVLHVNRGTDTAAAKL